MSFVLYAFGNLSHRAEMIAFFAQSGYPTAFLDLVSSVEILGGMALLVPWRRLVLAASFGLAVDMFGAVYTHLRNGDPLNDSTDAIAMLLRLAAIAALSVRGRTVAAGAVAAALLAIAGAAVA